MTTSTLFWTFMAIAALVPGLVKIWHAGQNYPVMAVQLLYADRLAGKGRPRGHFRKGVSTVFRCGHLNTQEIPKNPPRTRNYCFRYIYIYIFVEEVFWKFLMLQCPIGYWFDVYWLEYSSNYGMVQVPNLLGQRQLSEIIEALYYLVCPIHHVPELCNSWGLDPLQPVVGLKEVLDCYD